MAKKLTASELMRKALVLRLKTVYEDMKQRNSGDVMGGMAEAIGTTRETLSRWFNWHVLPSAHVPAIARYLEKLEEEK